MDAFLRATEFVESDHPEVVRFSRGVVSGASDDVERSIRLYYAVRDGIRYDPYSISDDAQTVPGERCTLDRVGLLHSEGGSVLRGGAGGRDPVRARLCGREEPPEYREASPLDGYRSLRLPRICRGSPRRPVGQGNAGVQYRAVRAILGCDRWCSTAAPIP